MAKNSFLTEVTFKHVLNKKGKICPVTDCRVMECTLCKDYSKQSQKSNRTFLSKVFESIDSLFRLKKDIPLPPTAPPYAPPYDQGSQKSGFYDFNQTPYDNMPTTPRGTVPNTPTTISKKTNSVASIYPDLSNCENRTFPIYTTVNQVKKFVSTSSNLVKEHTHKIKKLEGEISAINFTLNDTAPEYLNKATTRELQAIKEIKQYEIMALSVALRRLSASDLASKDPQQTSIVDYISTKTDYASKGARPKETNPFSIDHTNTSPIEVDNYVPKESTFTNALSSTNGASTATAIDNVTVGALKGALKLEEIS